MGYGTKNPQKVIVETPDDSGLRGEVESLTLSLAEKANIKRTLLDTMVANSTFLSLRTDATHPILQGGAISEDGTAFYCVLTTSGDTGAVIQKYSIGNLSDFSTWTYVTSSAEMSLSHGNDMCIVGGKMYVTNTNAYPTHIEVIDPNTLTIIDTKIIQYGATAISYNKKLNMFITRRKNEFGKLDFYDANFQYVKTVENTVITFDTVQGIDSDDDYIYEPMSDASFGSSVLVFDLNGNFIKRMGSNVTGEVEFMTNRNNYTFAGFYSTSGNYVGLMSIDTARRLTSARYVLSQGRNTSLYTGTAVFNGSITLPYPITYYTHLSFWLTADGIETETKIIDLTDGQRSHIINSFRQTGSNQLIFYRSLLVISADYKTLTITPVAFYQINADGTRSTLAYSTTPASFTVTTSLGISNIAGQILSGQRING